MKYEDNSGCSRCISYCFPFGSSYGELDKEHDNKIIVDDDVKIFRVPTLVVTRTVEVVTMMITRDKMDPKALRYEMLQAISASD